MSSLEVVQKIAKVLKILAKIGMVFAFVGAGLCLISSGVMFMVSAGTLPEELVRFIAEQNGMPVSELAVLVLAAFVICAAAGVSCAYCVRWLRHELEDGTPFTMRCAKEMLALALGIRLIAYPVGGSVIAAVICACGHINCPFDNYFVLDLGIILIVSSFILRHGAEIAEREKN